jgi:hypothetical protein
MKTIKTDQKVKPESKQGAACCALALISNILFPFF